MREHENNNEFYSIQQSKFNIALSWFVLIFASLFILKHSELEYFMPGMLLGSLYVTIGLYYYHTFFLRKISFYKLNHEQFETLESLLLEANVSYRLRNWFIPACLLNLLLALGLGTVLSLASPLIGSPITHPSQYGQIYKRLNTYETLVMYKSPGENAPQNASDDHIPPEKMAILNEIKSLHFQTINSRSSGTCVPCLQRQPEDTAPCMPIPAPLSFLIKEHASCPQIVESVVHAIPFLIAATFTLLGVMIYSFLDMLTRLFINDFNYTLYINYGLRYITSLTIGVVIAYYSSNEWSSHAMPILFLGLGMFPQRAMSAFENIFRNFLQSKLNASSASITTDNLLPLTLLGGVDDYTRQRFEENGIRDVRHLITADLETLNMNMRSITRSQLTELVSQALLLAASEKEYPLFIAMGIRGYYALKAHEQSYKTSGSFDDAQKKLITKILTTFTSATNQARIERLEQFATTVTETQAGELLKRIKTLNMPLALLE